MAAEDRMGGECRVGLTRDFLSEDGSLAFDIGLDVLEGHPEIVWEFLPQFTPQLRREDVGGYDALLVLSPKVTAQTVEAAERLVLVARFGVGYDSVDVAACTRQGIVLTITPDGVRRPVAVSAMAYVLALSLKLLIKDRLTRAGRWHEKLSYMGTGLTGRVLGLVGLGNIGREICRLAAPFELRILAADPYVTRDAAASVGAELVALDDLLRVADFVCICAALTDASRHLIDARRLALMKPTAYLINVARGPIVDQGALTRALQDGHLQGAGLDVFEQEPPDPHDPLFQLDSVIVSPHGICWTDECFTGNGRSAWNSILNLAAGREPAFVVNREALSHPRFRERLRAFAQPGRMPREAGGA
jgi:phosphoglycerate dehydrogenase-like enzyme